MQFRLTYQGKLLAHRNGGKKEQETARAEHKHSIRKQFHQQLRTLWTTNPVLKLRYDKHSFYANESPDALGNNFARNGFRFAPLVSFANARICKVEILMLRPGRPSGVMSNSDIDNRLKTLFDALRMTRDQQELGDATPDPDEDPFFVVLEDDSLITHVAVETDTMLQAITDDANEVRLVISVTIRPYNMTLLGSEEFL